MDDKAQRIAEVKSLIGEAETEKALLLLTEFLERHPSYTNVRNDALQALSQYRKTKKEEGKGIISYDQARLNYNQVTDQVLNILELLESEEKIAPGQRTRWPLVAGLAAMLLLGGGAVYWYVFRDKAVADYECPTAFSGSPAFNILLMPFKTLTPDSPLDLSTPGELRQFFITFSSENDIALNPIIMTPLGPQFVNDVNRFPPDFPAAEGIGENCEAKLIVWGHTIPQETGAVVTLRYKFIGLEKGFSLKKVKALNPEVTVVDTLRSTADITLGTQGELQRGLDGLETDLKILAGIIAHQENQPDLVIKTMSDLDTSLSAGMMLADAYLQTGREDMAEQTYNDLLENHPDYWLGWYNRGMIHLNKGEYDLAISDLSTRLEKNAKDPSALAGRAQAYLAVKRLNKAEDDLQAARQLKPADPDIELQLQVVRDSIERQQAVRRDAEAVLQRTPNDEEALRQLATSSLQLGDSQTAIDAGRKLMELRPVDSSSHLILSRAYEHSGQPEEARKVIDAASRRGIIAPGAAQKFKQQIRSRQ